MTTATALGLQIAQRVRDPNQREILAAGYLSFINQAIDDLVLAGWLLPLEEDDSLVWVDGTFTYEVPEDIAYIQRIQIADSLGNFPVENIIPSGEWTLLSDGPSIMFYPDLMDFGIAGRTMRVYAQKRPPTDVSGGDTLTPGMQAFIRERAVAYAWEYLAGGVSELGQTRFSLSQSVWQKSEMLLARHPQEYRVKVNSILVPGR